MAGVTEFNQKENSTVHIKKRNGYQVKFEAGKISDAIKALVATGKPDFSLSEKLANKVAQRLVQHGYGSLEIPSVEDVQDVVEAILIEEGLSETANYLKRECLLGSCFGIPASFDSLSLIASSPMYVNTIRNEHRSAVNRSIPREQVGIEVNYLSRPTTTWISYYWSVSGNQPG
jgi:ATP cone domain-containing protein